MSESFFHLNAQDQEEALQVAASASGRAPHRCSCCQGQTGICDQGESEGRKENITATANESSRQNS
jgi:hypothetical protein